MKHQSKDQAPKRNARRTTSNKKICEAKGWSPERRRRQAENIRKTKPWEQSTGPRTDAGKAACAQNAVKHGLETEEMLTLRRLLRAQRAFLRQIDK